jgi:heme oxygenase
LGDLSGGRVIRRRLAKAYDIDVESGEGVRFYDFKNLEGTRSGTVGDFKKIKEWYRAGMNAGTADNEECKGESSKSAQSPNLILNAFQAALLEEANRAFELNMNLLSTLKPPSSPKPVNSTAVSFLGDTESDIDDSESISAETKEIPIEILQGDGQPQERMVSLASVFSVVVAVCLAHFLLVTTGLTGTAWIEKLKNTGLSVF